MFQKSVKYDFYCKQHGHESQIIRKVCIYQDCEGERKCCQSCINNHNHCSDMSSSRYLISYDIIKHFLRQRDKLRSELLTNIAENEFTEILHNEVIKIAIPNRQIAEEKTLYIRLASRTGSELVLSNNERFIAFKNSNQVIIMDIQDGLKVFRIQRVQSFILSICFSPTDTYMYICSSNQLIQLKISENSQTFVDGLYVENTGLFCVSEIEILLCLNNRIEILDFLNKQQKQIVTMGASINSLAFQAVSKHFACLISKRISIYNIFGQCLCEVELIRKFEGEQKIQFFENKDILLYIDRQYLIIWKVDYTNSQLILQKIILCNYQLPIESFGLRGVQNKIYFHTDGRIAVYSLGDDKLQSFQLRNNEEFQYIPNLQNILVTKNKVYLIKKCQNIDLFSVRVIRNNQMNI